MLAKLTPVIRFPFPVQLVNLESCDSHVLEEMLFHFSKLLHPNHYILIDIMHNLVIKEEEYQSELYP